MNTPHTPDELGAQDENARAEWEDGEGAEVATSSGIWHAAIAYERNRVAALRASVAPSERAVKAAEEIVESHIDGRNPEDTWRISREIVEILQRHGLGVSEDTARMLNVARGCLDYGGGYRSNEGHLEIFHHGIQTVINALEAAAKRDPKDTQVNALERIGNAARGNGGAT